IRRPEERMGVRENRLPARVLRAVFHHGETRLAQRFRTRKLRVTSVLLEKRRYELPRRARLHGPVRDQQRATAGVEESAAQARDRLRACTIARRGVASRE